MQQGPRNLRRERIIDANSWPFFRLQFFYAERTLSKNWPVCLIDTLALNRLECLFTKITTFSIYSMSEVYRAQNQQRKTR